MLALRSPPRSTKPQKSHQGALGGPNANKNSSLATKWNWALVFFYAKKAQNETSTFRTTQTGCKETNLLCHDGWCVQNISDRPPFCRARAASASTPHGSDGRTAHWCSSRCVPANGGNTRPGTTGPRRPTSPGWVAIHCRVLHERQRLFLLGLRSLTVQPPLLPFPDCKSEPSKTPDRTGH